MEPSDWAIKLYDELRYVVSVDWAASEDSELITMEVNHGRILIQHIDRGLFDPADVHLRGCSTSFCRYRGKLS